MERKASVVHYTLSDLHIIMINDTNHHKALYKNFSQCLIVHLILRVSFIRTVGIIYVYVHTLMARILYSVCCKRQGEKAMEGAQSGSKPYTML